MVSALLGGGYRTKLGAWQAGPYGWVHYAHLDEESFTESGAGGVSLRMGSRDSDSLSSLLGVRLSRPSDDGLFVPELEAGWRRSFRLDDRELGGAFAGTSGPGFAIDGRDTEGSSARVSGALHWIDRERLSLTTRLGGELGPGYQELFGALQLSGRF
jgi:outer membrane autotransporter protein